jgi:hypothetical protein
MGSRADKVKGATNEAPGHDEFGHRRLLITSGLTTLVGVPAV